MAANASSLYIVNWFMDDCNEWDDTTDDILIFSVLSSKIRRQHVPKVIGFVENIIPRYSDRDFRSDFR